MIRNAEQAMKEEPMLVKSFEKQMPNKKVFFVSVLLLFLLGFFIFFNFKSNEKKEEQALEFARYQREKQYEKEQKTKGLVKYQGRWITREQKYRQEQQAIEFTKYQKEKKRREFEKKQLAKGLIKYKGKWTSKEQIKKMLIVERERKKEEIKNKFFHKKKNGKSQKQLTIIKHIFTSSAKKIKLIGNKLYVLSDTKDSLKIFDRHFSLLTSVNTIGKTYDVTAYKNQLFILTKAGIEKYKIKKSHKTYKLGTYPLKSLPIYSNIDKMAIQNGYLYVATGKFGVIGLNLDKGNVMVFRNVYNPVGDIEGVVAVRKTHIYALISGYIVQVLNVSDPNSVKFGAGYHMEYRKKRMVLKTYNNSSLGIYRLVGIHSGGYRDLEISNPQKPGWGYNIKLNSNLVTRDLAITKSGLAFVLFSENTILIRDLKTNENISRVTLKYPVKSIEVNKNYLFAVAENKIIVCKIANKNE